MSILVGDLGGTHTRLALAEVVQGQVALHRTTRYNNNEHADLAAILSGYLADQASCPTCCLAVAGPTDGERVQFTNLDWCIETTTLSAQFGFNRCHLINDFAAVGWGLNTLTPKNQAILQDGQPSPGSARVALGAGTGLGVSLCTWRENHLGGHYQPQPSEGGHIGFAPGNGEQDRLLGFLRTLHGRVSVERILSGPGLVDLFRFCLLEAGQSDSPLLSTSHPAQAISQAGLDPNAAADGAVAAHCLRLFAEIYGQTAGDWALAAQASGGVFLAGGIAPKLLPVLQSGAFLAGFSAKGRYRDWMAGIPVSVILDPDIGLKGAAFAAAHSR